MKPTPPPPDRAQSNESVPAWIKEAVHLLKFARVLTAEELENAAGVIHSVYRLNLPYMAAPPVSQRATGEEKWAADLAYEITSLIAHTPTDQLADDKLRILEHKIFARIKRNIPAPRSLPHRLGVECSPTGKALIMGDMQIMEGETPGDYTGIFVEFTRADLRKMKWNPMYQPVRLVPAVDGSKGAS